MKSKTLSLVVGLGAWSLCASTLWAIPISWNVLGDGDFQVADNWDPNQVPSFGDDVFFQNGASPTVTFLGPAQSDSLTVSTGNVTFDLSGVGYSLLGNVDISGMPPAMVSLQVDSGSLSAGGTVNVHSDAALTGDGTVGASQVVIDLGGQLRGDLMISTGGPGTSGVLNSGAVAPGNSPGVIFIDGNYEQTSAGTLEIEVGGLNPGTEHDQLVVTGSAFLAGRLDLPILSPYTPAPGHTINFLQAAGVNGSFEFITVPDLPAVGVAVQIGPPPAGAGAAVYFVSPTAKSFAGGPGPHTWGNPSTWGGMIPTTTDVVTIANNDPNNPLPQRIDLDLSSTASARAFAHSVSLFGVADTMALGVHEGTALSAISNVTLGNLGRLELSNGTVYTNLVQVNVGGTVSGAGLIVGDVVVGTDAMSGEATLDPDYILGDLNIEQDLTLNSDAALQIVIQDALSFDRVLVDQTATLGGRLVIDASNYTAPIGTQFNVMLSGAIQEHFDSVETVGAETIFFAAPPVPPLAALGPEAYTVQSYSIGDMNLDNFVNSADAPDFVLGLLDPLQYWTTHGFMFPVQAGNFHPDSSFDFDDIQGFADAVGALTAADIYALIEQLSVPEPTTGGLLLVALGLLGATRLPSRRCFG